MTEILFIYAINCLDCIRMKRFIDEAISVTGKNFNVIEVNSDTKEAIDLAIEHGIEDIPACVIGDNKFFGKDGFSYDQILESVKKLK
ncbi:MAG: hypothetical protein WC119_07545 [Synergistaceae bacterium]